MFYNQTLKAIDAGLGSWIDSKEEVEFEYAMLRHYTRTAENMYSGLRVWMLPAQIYLDKAVRQIDKIIEMAHDELVK